MHSYQTQCSISQTYFFYYPGAQLNRQQRLVFKTRESSNREQQMNLSKFFSYHSGLLIIFASLQVYTIWKWHWMNSNLHVISYDPEKKQIWNYTTDNTWRSSKDLHNIQTQFTQKHHSLIVHLLLNFRNETILLVHMEIIKRIYGKMAWCYKLVLLVGKKVKEEASVFEAMLAT